MPWYQVAGMVLGTAVSLIVVAKFLGDTFTRAVSAVMANEIHDLHRALDDLDRQNAHRFAAVDNALGAIQAQFHPNGGNSHRDKLEQVHQQVFQLAAKLDRMSGA